VEALLRDMSKELATHPIKLYWNYAVSDYPLDDPEKSFLLKAGIRSLLDIGRISLSAEYGEKFIPQARAVRGEYVFEAVYIGRKAVYQKGIRHHFREKHRDFMKQPLCIPRY